MLKKINFLIILLLFSVVFIFILKTKKKTLPLKKGNQKITSFSKAKKIAKNIYKYHQYTFYCNCPYTRNKIHYENCNYTPIDKENKRSQRVEWEHIVPASVFGKTFSSWTNGHQNCKTKPGTKIHVIYPIG